MIYFNLLTLCTVSDQDLSDEFVANCHKFKSSIVDGCVDLDDYQDDAAFNTICVGNEQESSDGSECSVTDDSLASSDQGAYLETWDEYIEILPENVVVHGPDYTVTPKMAHRFIDLLVKWAPTQLEECDTICSDEPRSGDEDEYMAIDDDEEEDGERPAHVRILHSSTESSDDSDSTFIDE